MSQLSKTVIRAPYGYFSEYPEVLKVRVDDVDLDNLKLLIIFRDGKAIGKVVHLGTNTYTPYAEYRAQYDAMVPVAFDELVKKYREGQA